MRIKRKIINSIQITFPSISVNEGLSRSFVASFAMQLNPTIEELADIKCAVSEAVTNAIVHAYKGTVGQIKLKCIIYDEGTVVIEVSDKGCGIEDIAKAREPLFTTNSDGDRSGMGFTVMETFTDKISVSSKVGKGTKVRLIKKIEM